MLKLRGHCLSLLLSMEENAPLFEERYKLARRRFRKLGYDDRRVIAGFLASELRTSLKEEILAQMRKPRAIKWIVIGEWRQWRVPREGTRQKVRLSIWLRIGLLLRKSREARRVLKMAINQNINPFEDYPRPWTRHKRLD